MCILRIKNSSGINENQAIIPDFLQVDADVTDYKEFKSINLSLKDSPLKDSDFLLVYINAIYDKQKSAFKFEERLRKRPQK